MSRPFFMRLKFFPEKYRWLFKLNPLIFALNGCRLAVYYGQLPQMPSIAASFFCGFGALAIGYWIFQKHQAEFVFFV